MSYGTSRGAGGGIALPPLRAGPHQLRLNLIAVVATVGCLLFGYDTGVLNGALEPMKHDLHPLQIRGLGMGASVLALRVTNVIITYCFPFMLAVTGLTGSYLVFAVLGVVAIGFLCQRINSLSNT